MILRSLFLKTSIHQATENTVYLEKSYFALNTTSYCFFFYLLLGCLKANFGPLSRKQPHQSDIGYCP